MGQFKPMVKMMTTEPSVILKLKKGGKVAKKADGGYMPMQSTMPTQEAPSMPARGGLAAAASPMKPSMADRRKAMMAKPKPPMNASLLMKKGGKADCETVEKELKEHKATPMKQAHKKATGGVVNGQGGFANGGIIKSTKGETKMVTAKVDHSPAKTGGVKLGNGGGYATGGVAKANAGGYKKGGKAEAMCGGGMMSEGGSSKKAYATGGEVSTGKAQAMPGRPASRPVANNMQSGTFKKGGKVGKFSEGGDASKGAYDKAIGPDADDMDMAKSIRAVPRKLYETAKEGFKSLTGMGSKPAGSVTKTEKSVTVAPKKRGGSC